MMKKILLLTALFALCFGCKPAKDNEEVDVLGDTYLIAKFVVKNETERAIIVTDAAPEDMFKVTSPVNVAAGEEKTVREAWYPTNQIRTEPLPDMFEDGNTLIYDAPDHGFDVEVPLSMTIDGEPVSVDIWKRKHWNFTSEVQSGFYHWIYTLTVTDALLASLPAAE
jgi:hypothetical protein